MPSDERETLIQEWQAAFREANPGKEAAKATYERGWIVFRHDATGNVPSRVRARDLPVMIGRLKVRALAARAEAGE